MKSLIATFFLKHVFHEQIPHILPSFRHILFTNFSMLWCIFFPSFFKFHITILFVFQSDEPFAQPGFFQICFITFKLSFYLLEAPLKLLQSGSGIFSSEIYETRKVHAGNCWKVLLLKPYKILKIQMKPANQIEYSKNFLRFSLKCIKSFWKFHKI